MPPHEGPKGRTKMRMMKRLRGLGFALPLILFTMGVITGACALGPAGNSDNSARADDEIPWRDDIPHIVPEVVHKFLQDHGWGDYHLYFHMTRRWFILGNGGRQWLTSVGE